MEKAFIRQHTHADILPDPLREAACTRTVSVCGYLCRCASVFVGALSLFLSLVGGRPWSQLKNGVNFFSYGRGEWSLHGNREKEPRGGTPEQHHPRPSLVTHTSTCGTHKNKHTHTHTHTYTHTMTMHTYTKMYKTLHTAFIHSSYIPIDSDARLHASGPILLLWIPKSSKRQ